MSLRCWLLGLPQPCRPRKQGGLDCFMGKASRGASSSSTGPISVSLYAQEDNCQYDSQTGHTAHSELNLTFSFSYFLGARV